MLWKAPVAATTTVDFLSCSSWLSFVPVVSCSGVAVVIRLAPNGRGEVAYGVAQASPARKNRQPETTLNFACHLRAERKLRRAHCRYRRLFRAQSRCRRPAKARE